MDVTNLMKVNVLAKELKKHGFASDINDAVSQAEGMVSEQPQIQEISTRTLEDQEKKVQAGEQAKLRELETKFYCLMQEQDKKHAEQMKCLQENLKLMLQEIQLLKEMKFEKQKEIIEEVKKEMPAPQPMAQEAPRQEAEKKEAHPRQGNYKSEDVSIEKFFYFGNR